jgi:N-acyl-D-amino-acid deacylase
MRRRGFLAGSAKAAAGVALAPALGVEAAPPFDTVVRGGTILDGTGAPAFSADLGIVGDRIAALGAIPAEQGRRAIVASGLAVCPGFIDIHTHSDGDILAYPTADSRVRQGVTTEVTGNCGSSAAPLAGVGAEERRARYLERDRIEAAWTDVASYCVQWEKTRCSANHALLLGQGTLRANAIGVVDRPLSSDERAAVLRATEEGMDQGGFGLSTGLQYTPGRFTPREEIVAMARLVARHGGFYATHMRNEDATLLEAIGEAIAIGREAQIRVEISHLKAAGQVNWHKQRGALDLIEAARASGVDVLADVYPYTAYSTGLSILLEDWALDGGREAMLGRLRDPGQRSRIRGEVDANVHAEPGGYELIVIAGVEGERNRAAIGKDLKAIAAGWGVEPVDALLRLLDEEGGRVPFIGHAMSEANVDLLLAHPLVMVGSDGSSMAPVGRAATTRPHPRSYGCFARVLGHYARDRKLLELPAAVRKMTSLPADQVGLRDRGRIARGMKADLVVFDPATVRDEASFDDPHRYASGIAHVLVNGEPVVEQGRHTGARPGKLLRRA